MIHYYKVIKIFTRNHLLKIKNKSFISKNKKKNKSNNLHLCKNAMLLKIRSNKTIKILKFPEKKIKENRLQI